MRWCAGAAVDGPVLGVNARESRVWGRNHGGNGYRVRTLLCSGDKRGDACLEHAASATPANPSNLAFCSDRD